MPLPLRSPFEGNPRTIRETLPDGSPIIKVTLSALTPRRRWLIDRARWVIGGAACAGVLYQVSQLYNPPLWAWGTPVAAGLSVTVLTHFGLGKVLQKRHTVSFTRDCISFRTWRDRLNFDRRHPHAFVVIPHDKTDREEERLSKAEHKAQMKGRVIRKKRYFGKSSHLYFEYYRQRYDLIAVYGPQRALTLAYHLQTVDELIDAEAQTGKGTALRPADEWSVQPGSL